MLLGAWLRFSQIPGLIWFLPGHDESRDMLVARHIVEYGDWVWRGPLAAGSANQLMNSPGYYYFLATLWFFSRSAIGFMVLWAGIQTMMIVVAYMVGTMLWDSTLGCIAALFVAVHQELVYNSWHMSQPYLLPLWCLLFLAVMFARRPWTPLRISLAIGVLTAGIHFHYGSLIILPIGMVWIAMVAVRCYRKDLNVRWVIAPLLTCDVLLLGWVWLTYRFAPFDQIFFLTKTVSHHTVSGYLWLVNYVYDLALFNAWWGMRPEKAIGIMLTFIGIGFIYIRRYPQARISAVYGYLLMLVFLPPFIAALFGNDIHAVYILGVLPVTLLLMAIGLRIVVRLNRILGVLLVVLFALVNVGYVQREIHLVGSPDYYSVMHNIAIHVASDYRSITPSGSIAPSQPRFVIAMMTKNVPFDGWGAGSIWFFLEDIFQMRLITLIDLGVNFSPVIRDVRYIYVICDYRDNAGGTFQLCANKFRSVRTYLALGEKLVYKIPSFTVWRFAVDSNAAKLPDYNMVYLDML